MLILLGRYLPLKWHTSLESSLQISQQIRKLTDAMPLQPQETPNAIVTWCGGFCLGIKIDCVDLAPCTSASVCVIRGEVSVDFTQKNHWMSGDGGAESLGCFDGKGSRKH